MSDEAEDKAKLLNLSTFKEAREAKERLAGQLRNWGKSLGDFAEALRRPEGYIFDVADDCITVGQPGMKPPRPVARLTSSEMDWNALREALRGYIRAKEDKRGSAAALGLPVAE